MATPAHKKPKPAKSKSNNKPKAKPKAPLRGYSDSTPQGRADKTKEEARKKKIKDEFSNEWSEPQFFHEFGRDAKIKKK